MAQALAELCSDTVANPLKKIQIDHKAFQKTIINKERGKKISNVKGDEKYTC